MKHDVKYISDQFCIYGDFLSAQPYGSGHINDTYATVVSQSGKQVRYIFQRINHNVFKQPAQLMDNIARVTRHCKTKFAADDKDASRKALTVLQTKDGKDFFVDAEGNHWRCYLFIENARTYDVPESEDQIFQAARAFGNFQKMLVDLPGGPLFETIPDFHNGPKRFQALQDAIKADKCNRAAAAKADIEAIEKHSWIFNVLPELVEKGKIPVRTTHNDTKINNVMIDDKSGEGICVIDLDTVMPGLALYDFGDMVRTTVSPSEEDETDLSKVGMVPSRFEAVLRGYLSSAGEFLNDDEKANLILSGKMITLMIGTRFLTDYLSGDVYFKIHRPEHNLDRCRTQVKIVDTIAENEEQLNKLLETIL